jgi:amino acid transporter
MTYALAREGLMPAVFAYVHPTFRTPVVSIAAFGAFVLALAIAGSFAWLAAMSVSIRLLLYVGCVAATWRLRRRAVVADTSGAPSAVVFRAPGAPALAGLLCVALLTQVPLQSFLATAALLGVGLVLFGFAQRGARWSSDR